MSEKYIIGIDVGTTGTKTVVFNTNGVVISKAYYEYGSIYPQPGWVEQDAALILKLTLSACREALQKAAVSQTDKVSVGLSTQRACAIFIDKDGNPLKMFSWQDCRPKEEAELIREKISDEEFYAITGIPNNPAWILHKMMWVQKHEPEIWGKTTKIIQLHDYILKALGADDYYTSETDVGFYCAWNIDQFCWDEKLVNMFSLDVNRFSKVKVSGTVVGSVDSLCSQVTGLPVNTPVVVGSGDQTCASIGAGVISPGSFSISMGTGGMCLGFLDKPYRDPRASFMIVNHAIHGNWELEGWQKGSAGIFRWFRDEIATLEKQNALQENKNVYEVLNVMMEKVPAGAKGLITMPYFATAGTPRWNDNARGAIFGLSYAHDKACLARSVIEGITLEYKDMLESLKLSGIPVLKTSIIGGPTKSELWNQIQADMYGIPVEKPVFEDASVLGAAIIGAVSVGEFQNIQEAVAQLVKIDKVYEPNLVNAKIYNELYKIYVSVYEGLDNSGAFDMISEFQKKFH